VKRARIRWRRGLGGRVGGGFQFPDQGAFGGVDLGEVAADGLGLLVAALFLPGGGGIFGSR
jgi:hypothetical protein